MPFTFAHPALVLPLTFLKRQWFSATGLVIGSMTPDFEYFIRLKVQSDYSHTLPGLLWFDLPLGLLLCFAFHNIARNSLIDNSPIYLNKRLAIFKSFEWREYFKKNWVIVLISVLVGAFSHLLWDSFTHESGFFVTRLRMLQRTVQLGNWAFPLYKIVQHLSTVLGGLAIIITLSTLKKYSISPTDGNYKYWISIIIISMTVLILRLTSGMNYNQYGDVIVTFISGGLVALIVTPLILKRE